MGRIESFGKWNLKDMNWQCIRNSYELGRSFAIASYDDIINNDGKIDYIIIANGSRVEDHSKDGFEIKERELRIDNVLSHYGNLNGNYSVKVFLMDADAPIIEDARRLAYYIEKLALSPKTNSVNVIGLSKCGVMNFYIPSFFRNPNTFSKTNIYNIAAPYDGTKLASPLIFYPELKKYIFSIFRNERITEFVYNKVISMYEGVSSNSHMDYDIAIPGGIPQDKIHLYDERLVKEVFRDKNVSAIQRLNCFRNMVTGINSNTLKEALLTMNYAGIGLCLFDDIFFDNKSDGMVLTASQEKVGQYLDVNQYRLEGAHHDVNSNIRVFNEVLSVVDDTIDEFNVKSRSKKR